MLLLENTACNPWLWLIGQRKDSTDLYMNARLPKLAKNADDVSLQFP